MVTESGVGRRLEDTLGGVMPAPTLWSGPTEYGSGCGKLFCLAMFLISAAGPALTQSRYVAGAIPPAPVATKSGGPTELPAKVLPDGNGRKIVKVGTEPNLKIQAKLLPRGRFESRPEVVAASKGKRQPEPGKFDFLPLVSVPLSQSARMDECRQQIQAALQPARLIKLSEECERDFPATQFADQIRGIAAGARRSLDIQRSIGLSGDFFEDSTGDAAYRDNLGKAVRGDKDAAYLIALAYRLGLSGVAASSRRMEQWLRFSAELGSGLASWELAEHYNYGGLVADAARFEKRALELGYRPPFRLPTRGY